MKVESGDTVCGDLCDAQKCLTTTKKKMSKTKELHFNWEFAAGGR